ncbi:MAG: flagellar basal body rod protein FlgC [Phycisphaerales bacterium]|nr:flagellar basal body rod protein FlgC [Phycisphaerales bacterium]
MYGLLDISTSGLIAQRTRLNVIAANLANRSTLLGPDGEFEPYRRRIPILASGTAAGGPGVHVEAIEIDQSPLAMRYEPGSRFADADGYVSYPNVSPVIEQMNAMEAMRAYEANITTIEATKSMMNIAFRIIA